MTTRSHRRRGSQAVEFALVLPVLLALTSGIVDYGWYYSQYLTVISAARDGARVGAATSSTSTTNPCSTAKTRVSSNLTAAGISATPSTNTATVTTSSGEQIITVSLVVPYGKLVGLVPAPSTMAFTVVMRLEDQANTTCSA